MAARPAPPERGLVIDLVAAAEALARTPAVHGTPPWRLEPLGRGAALRTAPGRRLRSTDPDARGLRLTCGAGLLVLRLAVAAQGIRPVVGLLPDPTRPGLVATLHPSGAAPPAPDEAALFGAVLRARSRRAPLTRRPVVAAHRSLLRRAAEVEGAWLHAVDEPRERHRLRELLRQQELRFPRLDPGLRGGPPPDPGPPVRTGADPSALLLVLGTHNDLPVTQLRAGQALQRVLLTAALLGLAWSVLPAATAVRSGREGLRRMYDPGLHPQVVVRLGHPVG